MTLTDSSSATDQPEKSASTSFGGPPAGVLSSGPSFGSTSSNPKFGTVSKSPSEDTNPFSKPAFGKPSSSSEPAASRSSFGGLGMVSFASSERKNVFGKPSSSSEPAASQTPWDQTPWGMVGRPHFLTPNAPAILNPSLISPVMPPPGTWPNSNMVSIPPPILGASATLQDSSLNGPFIFKPPPGAWPGSDMFDMFSGVEPRPGSNISSTPVACSDPEMLPPGLYQYDDGATVEKKPDGSITRNYGEVRIETDPEGNSIRFSPIMTTPISKEYIPEMVGVPRKIGH